MNRAEAIEFAKSQQEIFGGRMGEFLKFVEDALTQTNTSNALNALHDDTISRQTAIDALLRNQEVYSNNFGTDAIDKYTIAIIDNDVQTIAQLPSAERRGKWIENESNSDILNCSECGEAVRKAEADILLRSTQKYNYCPNCGAKMITDKDDTQ